MSPALGMHSTITRAEYDALTEFLNLSRLKKVGVAPALFKHALTEQTSPDSNELKFGRVCHIAVFEPDRLSADVAEWNLKTASGNLRPRNGKDWDAFEAEHASKEIVTEDEMMTAKGMRDAVYANPKARELVTGGSAEATVIWKIDGFNLKVRLDYVNQVITDLKSARCSKPSEFFWQAFKLGYHVQAAWTHDAVLVTTGESKPFWDLAVEKTPPYLVSPLEFPEHMIARGRETYRGWLELVARCQDSGKWPGYIDGEEGGKMEFPPGARFDLPYGEEAAQ